MSFILAAAGNWRWILAAVVSVGLVWGGWVVKGKFARAAEADRLEEQYVALDRRFKAQIAATIEADKQRLVVSTMLAEAEARASAKTKEVIRVVRQTVTRDPVCNIPPGILRELNAVRGGPDVPEPTE